MPKLSTTLKAATERRYITDGYCLIEVISVNRVLSGLDQSTGKYVTIEFPELDDPKKWRIVIPAAT